GAADPDLRLDQPPAGRLSRTGRGWYRRHHGGAAHSELRGDSAAQQVPAAEL
ncbi:MAG: hypothetical protein AVDCRST_MAG21-79, partial [uncultured Nocardioidaceae bacterium]